MLAAGALVLVVQLLRLLVPEEVEEVPVVMLVLERLVLQ
jgi:hypothetical protein